MCRLGVNAFQVSLALPDPREIKDEKVLKEWGDRRGSGALTVWKVPLKLLIYKLIYFIIPTYSHQQIEKKKHVVIIGPRSSSDDRTPNDTIKLSFADMNECETGEHNCDADAYCNNTKGSFTCFCKPGYTGNGLTCTGNNKQLDHASAFVFLDTGRLERGVQRG